MVIEPAASCAGPVFSASAESGNLSVRQSWFFSLKANRRVVIHCLRLPEVTPKESLDRVNTDLAHFGFNSPMIRDNQSGADGGGRCVNNFQRPSHPHRH